MYLVGFGIAGGLGIFRLFDIFHHFPYEGVTVVLILGHDNLKDEPQSPNRDGKCDISIQDFEFSPRFYIDLKIPWILQTRFMSSGNNKIVIAPSILLGGKKLILFSA